MKRLLTIIWSCLTLTINAQTATDIYGTVTDIDGNVYKTVKIGDQVWMQENLMVTRFNDGTPIKRESLGCQECTSMNWDTLSPMFTSYDNYGFNTYFRYLNDSNIPQDWIDQRKKSLKDTYLYNGYVVDNEKNVCPVGWHVPSALEFKKLVMFTGGYKSWKLTIYKPNPKLDEMGYAYGNKSQMDTTSLFKVKGYGYHRSKHPFYTYGEPRDLQKTEHSRAVFWTTTKDQLKIVEGCKKTYDALYTWRFWFQPNFHFEYNVSHEYLYFKSWGFSIRCLKD